MTTVLYLHGFTGCGSSMDVLARRMSKHRALQPDLPGHGESVDASCEMTDVVDALAAELNGPAAVVGYSMGGRTALTLALRHPEVVSKLVLIGASAGLADATERSARVAADEALAAQIEQKGMPWFVDYWQDRPIFATQQSRVAPQLLDAQRQVRLSQRASGLASSLRGMGTGAMEPLHRRLAAASMPVLLLAGIEDPKFTSLAHQMALSLPNSQVQLIADAGHATHLEAPGVTAAAIGQFLEDDR